MYELNKKKVLKNVHIYISLTRYMHSFFLILKLNAIFYIGNLK